MKLIAMLVVHNELDRYLRECITNLLGFCDEIRILDDGSTDGWQGELMGAWGDDGSRVFAKIQPESTFYVHEGRTRQSLLEWAMEGEPTHLLAIDADEFVADGELLRVAIGEGSHTGVWKLSMTEIWGCDTDWLQVRTDGDWKPRPIGICFVVPPDWWSNRQNRRHWRLPDRPLACGRVPLLTQMAGNRSTADAVTEILHFGWANVRDRTARYQRYVDHDGGQFHASRHLDSIMWPDERVQTRPIRWPSELRERDAIRERANRP